MDLVERGGHADEVHEPQDAPCHATQFEVDQPREGEGDRSFWRLDCMRGTVFQFQVSKVRVSSEDLRELCQSVAGRGAIGEAEFQ